MYWATGILGIVLLVAPYLFGYTSHTAAFWTSLALGGVVLVISVLEGVRRGQDMWEYWVATIAGIGAVVAPFIFRFDNITAAFWTTLGVGVLLAILSASKVFSGTNTYT